MVRTDQMWRYARTIKLPHHHDGDIEGALSYSTLLAVTESKHQGWDFKLECGCKLQSCFGESEWEVEVIWHEDVLNWGKQPA